MTEGGANLVPEFYQVFARNMRDLGTPVYSRQLFETTLAVFGRQARAFVVRLGPVPVAAGIAIGFFARKFQSLPIGILFGVIVGALLALPIALMQGGYYFEIILPGTLVGLIVGFATQKYGNSPSPASN